MKRLFYIIAIVSFISCKKESNELLQTSTTEETGVTNSGLEAAAYKWYQMSALNTSNSFANDGLKVVQVNGNTYALSGGSYTNWYKLNNTTKRWEDDNGLLGEAFGSFGTGMQYFFSSPTKIFWGMNRTNDSIDHRFFSTNGITGQTIQLASFPGTSVDNPTCFATATKGYIMCGSILYGSTINQLWEYDFANNTWTK